MSALDTSDSPTEVAAWPGECPNPRASARAESQRGCVPVPVGSVTARRAMHCATDCHAVLHHISAPAQQLLKSRVWSKPVPLPGLGLKHEPCSSFAIEAQDIYFWWVKISGFFSYMGSPDLDTAYKRGETSCSSWNCPGVLQSHGQC